MVRTLVPLRRGRSPGRGSHTAVQGSSSGEEGRVMISNMLQIVQGTHALWITSHDDIMTYLQLPQFNTQPYHITSYHIISYYITPLHTTPHNTKAHTHLRVCRAPIKDRCGAVRYTRTNAIPECCPESSRSRSRSGGFALVLPCADRTGTYEVCT
jgi:hypothetical protein